MSDFEENWVVITKKDCPWCVKAKDMLDLYKVNYTIMDIEQYPNMRTFLKLSGLKTVPQVFVDGDRIAEGYEGMVYYLGEFYDAPN